MASGRTLDDAAILAEAGRWQWWPPDTTVIEEPEYLLTLWTEGPYRNIVHRSRAETRSGDELITEVLERLHAAGRTGLRW